MSDEVLLECGDGVATITLNRPQARNAITPGIVTAMTAFLQEVEHDRSIRCVLLRGSGEHFMAGGDVKSFSETSCLSSLERRRMFEARVQAVTPLLLIMQRMPQILVTAVRGACAGAGLSWVAASDLSIAARSAFFLQSQVKIAATADGSGTYWLPRTVGLKRAKEIALLGDRFSAEDAERWGLINRVVDDDDLDMAIHKLIRQLADGPSQALANTKRLMNASLSSSYAEQLQREAESFSQCAADADFAEGLSAFIEKRTARFGGHE